MLLDLFRELFLSPVLIFLVLFAIFAALSYWAVVILREYAGYLLGWLIGLFFVVVYYSLGGDIDSTGQLEQELRLNLIQVLCPGLFGLLLGGMLVFLIRLGQGYTATQGIKIAGLTALMVTLIFLMFVMDINGQRMIGIFALSFCIAGLFAMVIFRSSTPLFSGQVQAQAAPPSAPGGVPQGNSPVMSRLDEIRARMQQRTRR